MEPVAVRSVGGDVVVAAAEILHEGMSGGVRGDGNSAAKGAKATGL